MCVLSAVCVYKKKILNLFLDNSQHSFLLSSLPISIDPIDNSRKIIPHVNYAMFPNMKYRLFRILENRNTNDN